MRPSSIKLKGLSSFLYYTSLAIAMSFSSPKSTKLNAALQKAGRQDILPPKSAYQEVRTLFVSKHSHLQHFTLQTRRVTNVLYQVLLQKSPLHVTSCQPVGSYGKRTSTLVKLDLDITVYIKDKVGRLQQLATHFRVHKNRNGTEPSHNNVDNAPVRA